MQPYQEEYLANLEKIARLTAQGRAEEGTPEEFAARLEREEREKREILGKNMALLRQELFPALDSAAALTEAERQAEQEARNAALRASEDQRRAALVQGIRDKYAEADGSFDAVIKFLDNYKYYREEQPIACRVVWEHLDNLLESRNYELDSQEAVRFLHVCDKLVSGDALGFAEAQAYITKVKEC